MISINPDVKLIRKMENLSKNELKKTINKSKEIIKKAQYKHQIKIVKELQIQVIEEYNLYYKVYKIN